MLEAAVVDYDAHAPYQEVVVRAVEEMCSTKIGEYVTKDGGIIYLIEEKNPPKFLKDLTNVVSDKTYFREPGEFINYRVNAVECGLNVSAYSVLKETTSSFSVTLHEPDGSSFAVGFWTIKDYLKERGAE